MSRLSSDRGRRDSIPEAGFWARAECGIRDGRGQGIGRVITGEFTSRAAILPNPDPSGDARNGSEMIKTLSLIKRRPDLDRAAFRNHYETRHAPLALPLLDGLERYVRYHIEEALYGGVAGEVGFDVISAFWYRDRAATDAIFEKLRTEQGAAVLEDELRFMDKPANRFFPVSERRWQEGEEGADHVWIFLGRPAEKSRFDASVESVRYHWPALLERLGRVEFALLRDVFAMEGSEREWDAVLQVRTESAQGLEGWAKEREREGHRVLAVRTRRFETDLEAVRSG